MREQPEVIVIGAGLAGLTAAAFAARAGHTVRVMEGRGRIGGRAVTDAKNGYRFNQGAHALYRSGPGIGILRELGITPAGSPPNLDGSMLRGGTLHKAPAGPLSLMTTGLLGLTEKAELGKLLARLPRFDAAAVAGQSVAEWLDDNVTRPRVRATVEAVIRIATYVNRPAELSAEVAISQMAAAVDPGVLYLDHGWQQLVDGLERTGVTIDRDHRVTDLPPAPAVIVATGGPAAAAALCGTTFDVGPAAEVTSLDLGTTANADTPFVIGVDEPVYFSTHSVAAGMAPPDRHHFVAMRYLGPGDEPGRDQLDRLVDLVGLGPGVIETERYLHRMTAVTAIATADRGGLAGRPPVAVPDRPGVFVAGDWVGPEGHLADAALASGKAAALAAVEHLARRPVAG